MYSTSYFSHIFGILAALGENFSDVIKTAFSIFALATRNASATGLPFKIFFSYQLSTYTGFINKLFNNSSLGKNGAMSSRGGLINVPSSSLFVELFGSKI